MALARRPAESSSAIVARLDRLNKIAALARSDVEIFATSSDGNIFGLEPPWIHRRRRAAKALQEQQKQEKMALESFESLQRQLKQQGRQLEALAAGHDTQEKLQQQLMTLLNKFEKLATTKQEDKPRVDYVSHGQTPQEYHTIAWLNSHKPHHRQKRGDFTPVRKRWASRSLASEQTGTANEGVARLHRTVGSRSTVSREPSEHSDRSRRKQAEKRAECSSSPAEDVHIVGRKKTPVVAALYARCLRKARKKAASRAGDPSEQDSYRRAPSRAERSHPTTNEESSEYKAKKSRRSDERISEQQRETTRHIEKPRFDYNVQDAVPELKRPVPEMDDSKLLETMLSLQEQKEEHHWLVSEAQAWAQGTTLEQEENRDALLSEIAKLRREGTAYRSIDAAGAEESKIFASEWLTRELIDQALEDIAKELSMFCDDFVDHLYCSEFID